MQGRRGWISPGEAFVLQWTEIGWWWNTMVHCSLTFVLCCCSLCPSVCAGSRSTYMTFLTCNFFAVSESPNHLNPTKYTGMCQSTLNQLLWHNYYVPTNQFLCWYLFWYPEGGCFGMSWYTDLLHSCNCYSCHSLGQSGVVLVAFTFIFFHNSYVCKFCFVSWCHNNVDGPMSNIFKATRVQKV